MEKRAQVPNLQGHLPHRDYMDDDDDEAFDHVDADGLPWAPPGMQGRRDRRLSAADARHYDRAGAPPPLGRQHASAPPSARLDGEVFGFPSDSKAHQRHQHYQRGGASGRGRGGRRRWNGGRRER